MTDAETKQLVKDLVKRGVSPANARSQAADIQAHDQDVIEETIKPVKKSTTK